MDDSRSVVVWEALVSSVILNLYHFQVPPIWNAFKPRNTIRRKCTGPNGHVRVSFGSMFCALLELQTCMLTFEFLIQVHSSSRALNWWSLNGPFEEKQWSV